MATRDKKKLWVSIAGSVCGRMQINNFSRSCTGEYRLKLQKKQLITICYFFTNPETIKLTHDKNDL